MSVRYVRRDFGSVDFKALDAYADRTVFQTEAWMRFVAETQGAEPVVAELFDGERPVGWFSGLIVRKWGLKILGSPFPGWTTSYMGFNLVSGFPRRAALAGLKEFAFGPLGCVHVELVDRRLTEEDARAEGFGFQPGNGYEIDLTPTEDELFARLRKDCRTAIRRAAKEGVVIEEVRDPEVFAREYVDQLRDVFAKQSLVPTYDLARVNSLIRHLLPTGRLLLLRARSKEGLSIATALAPCFNDRMYFWGGASWREHQHLYPNEAIVWHAMLHWKRRGVPLFDIDRKSVV